MKAAYALGFLGLCAVVLVLHVYDAPEETREVEDPFLASLEAHVVAKAQRRLRQRAHKEASESHISEARKAIKAALLDAHSSSLHDIRQAEEQQEAKLVATPDAAPKKGAKQAKNAAAAPDAAEAAAPANGQKVYTWAELQRGDDAKKEIFTENKVGNLMTNLKAAPQADKSVEGTVVLGDSESDDSHNALTAALSHAKDSVGDDDEEEDKDDDKDDTEEDSEEEEEEPAEEEEESTKKESPKKESPKKESTKEEPAKEEELEEEPAEDEEATEEETDEEPAKEEKKADTDNEVDVDDNAIAKQQDAEAEDAEAEENYEDDEDFEDRR